MLIGESKIVDFLIGAVLFGVAMLYLNSQVRTINQLSDIVNDKVLEQKDLYQQSDAININQITDAELKAIIITYREYPIVIDGTVILADDMEYERYFPIIKEGIYLKNYQCNTNNEITQITYTYVNSMR